MGQVCEPERADADHGSAFGATHHRNDDGLTGHDGGVANPVQLTNGRDRLAGIRLRRNGLRDLPEVLPRLHDDDAGGATLLEQRGPGIGAQPPGEQDNQQQERGAADRDPDAATSREANATWVSAARALSEPHSRCTRRPWPRRGGCAGGRHGAWSRAASDTSGGEGSRDGHDRAFLSEPVESNVCSIERLYDL